VQILEHPQSKAPISSPNQTATRSNLSMVWVSELNHGRQCLVAKWVMQAVDCEM